VIDARTRVEVRPAGGGAPRVMNVIFDDNPNAPAAGQVKITRATGQLAFNAAEVPGANDQIVADYVAVGFRAVLINAPAGINPNNVSLANEATIGGAFPTIGGARIVRVFIAGGLATGVRGEAAPDIDFAGAPDQGTAFIHGGIRTAYTIAHETGHILTNKRAAANTGHYNPPVAPAGNRLHNNQNLMRNSTSPAEGVNQSKRLWNAPDQDGLDQFANIMGLPSPYTRNF
jgi:hypothetical protein